MNTTLAHKTLAQTMARYRYLEGIMVSGRPYTDEEFDEYMDTAEDLVFHPSNPLNLSGAQLEGIMLAGGIRGFFKKLGKVIKKAAPIIVTLVGAIVTIIPGGQVAGPAIMAGGGALAAAMSQWKTSKKDVKPPLVSSLVGTVTSAAAALNGLGVTLPTDLQNGVNFATAALTAMTPEQREATKQTAAAEINQAAVNHGKEDVIAPTMEQYLATLPTWVYVGGAVVGTAVLIATMSVLFRSSGSETKAA